MKATIRDQETLKTVRPLELVSYLRAQGWRQVSELDDKSALWEKPCRDHNQSEEVVLPLRQEVGDFALRVSEVLRTLEHVEHRSQLEILRDLLTSSSDLIRVRASAAQATSGSIPLDLGVKFVEEARDLMLAAACSAVDPRAYYARRKPAQANEYLSRVRMGQTERGSYVLTILSPVPPSLRAAELSDAAPSEPFERKVSQTLASALSAARVAAQRATVTGDVQPFREAVAVGVSANLCDALVGLGRVSSTEGIELSISWSRNRPLMGHVRSNFLFSPDMVPVFEEASRVFKETGTREDVEIEGFVIDLHRDEGAPTGRVVVTALIDEDIRKIAIELDESEYGAALRAHAEERSIRCTGDLVKQGRMYHLVNPGHLDVVAEPE
jgi:hypothetical protein